MNAVIVIFLIGWLAGVSTVVLGELIAEKLDYWWDNLDKKRQRSRRGRKKR
jgi:hypothetical protein